MSEPDQGTFVTAHRISGAENPVLAVRNGLCRQKYKPVDYKHLYELAAAEKMASAKIQFKNSPLTNSAFLDGEDIKRSGLQMSKKSPTSLEHVIKKTEQVSRMNKEQLLLKQHRQVWWQEHKRLSESRQKAEADIKTFLDEESHKHDFFLDMRNFEHKLSKERDSYQRNTVLPLWQLKENLEFRLSEMQCYLSEGSALKSEISPDEMLRQIEFVKKQQEAALEFLILESLALERELEDCKTKALAHPCEEKNGLCLDVPSALLALECPYPDLKTFVIDEYQRLAGLYWSKLQETDQQLEVLNRNKEWKEEDQWVFQTVINQYPSDLQRRRTLYLDVLQRYLPHRSRHDLVAQEKAWDRYQFIRNQRRALLSNWARARKAFLFKALTTFAEASAAHEAGGVWANSRQKQQEICAELRAKVLQWKAQQEEAAKLEAAVAARRKEKEDEKERLQKEHEMLRRAQEKEKLKKYWAEKQLKWQEQEEKDIQRLEELRKLMAEQAVKDRERVQFRRALLEKRLRARRELALRAARQAEDKEKSLAALRQQIKRKNLEFTLLTLQELQLNCVATGNEETLLLSDNLNSTSAAALSPGLPVLKPQDGMEPRPHLQLSFGFRSSIPVAVVAQSDPARAVADTVASKARVGVGAREEFGLQKPLFALHTYSEQQILSDPRLRVELALREAGLHRTLYAKEILPQIPPLRLPRRDMESTAFKTQREHLSQPG